MAEQVCPVSQSSGLDGAECSQGVAVHSGPGPSLSDSAGAGDCGLSAVVSVDWLSSVLIQSSSHCAMPRSRIVMLCTVPAEYLQIEIFLCSLNSVSSRYTLRLCESGLPLQGLCFELYGSVSRLGQKSALTLTSGLAQCFHLELTCPLAGHRAPLAAGSSPAVPDRYPPAGAHGWRGPQPWANPLARNNALGAEAGTRQAPFHECLKCSTWLG